MSSRTVLLSSLLLPLALAACGHQGPPGPPGAAGPGPGADPARDAALQACAQAQGVTAPAAGTRPDPALMQSLESCMQAKGFARPAGPPPGGHAPPPEG